MELWLCQECQRHADTHQWSHSLHSAERHPRVFPSKRGERNFSNIDHRCFLEIFLFSSLEKHPMYEWRWMKAVICYVSSPTNRFDLFLDADEDKLLLSASEGRKNCFDSPMSHPIVCSSGRCPLSPFSFSVSSSEFNTWNSGYSDSQSDRPICSITSDYLLHCEPAHASLRCSSSTLCSKDTFDFRHPLAGLQISNDLC